MLLSFFIIGGIMSDRIDRRKVMLWIQFIAAGTSLILALLVSTHTIQVWHIFVLGAVTSTTWAFEQPVRQALLPQLIPRDVLVNALALNAVTWNGAGLLGPSLVGISVGTIGIDGCFYANVVSYLAVVAALLRLHVPANVQEPGRGTVVQSLLGGFRYVRARAGDLYLSGGLGDLQYLRPFVCNAAAGVRQGSLACRRVRLRLSRRGSRTGDDLRLAHPGQLGTRGGQALAHGLLAACLRGAVMRLRREPQLFHRRRALGCHRRLEHGI